jgi:hypothetical protein
LQQGLYIEELLYIITICSIRLSVLFLYFRIFPNIYFKIYGYVVGAIVVAAGISDLLVAIFQCTPVPLAWDITITPGNCINFLAWFIAAKVIGFVLEVVILVFLIKPVWQLHLPLAEKLGVLGIFLTGWLSLIISAIRLGILINLLKNVSGIQSPRVWIWTIAEMVTADIAASLPTFRPLIRAVSSWVRETRWTQGGDQLNSIQPGAFVDGIDDRQP